MKPTILITINTYKDGREVSEILRTLADKLESWPGEGEFSMGCHDSENKRVGSAEATFLHELNAAQDEKPKTYKPNPNLP